MASPFDARDARARHREPTLDASTLVASVIDRRSRRARARGRPSTDDSIGRDGLDSHRKVVDVYDES